MIREVQRLLGKLVDVHLPPFARRTARVFQHCLGDAIGALAVVGDLFQIAGQDTHDIFNLLALAVIEQRGDLCEDIFQLLSLLSGQ